MLLPRLQPLLRAAIASTGRTGSGSTGQIGLIEAFAALNVCGRMSGLRAADTGARVSGTRYASHKAQGAVNKAKDGPGKRLGAKKSGEQYVIPGNIIFRQRGTHWFPGENCGMGRDHTIYATESGYVKYYKDPEKHPKRQYIGVVFERDMVLPLPRNSMRRRRLGMVAQPIEQTPTPEALTSEADIAAEKPLSQKARRKALRAKDSKLNLTLRPGYMYRESNWEIGRAAERAHVKVREFKPRDRWTAWRKTTERRLVAAQRKSLKARGGKKK